MESYLLSKVVLNGTEFCELELDAFPVVMPKHSQRLEPLRFPLRLDFILALEIMHRQDLHNVASLDLDFSVDDVVDHGKHYFLDIFASEGLKEHFLAWLESDFSIYVIKL